jgi:hypothetical protein
MRISHGLCGTFVATAVRWIVRDERIAASLVATQTPIVTIIAATASLENRMTVMSKSLC